MRHAGPSRTSRTGPPFAWRRAQGEALEQGALDRRCRAAASGLWLERGQSLSAQGLGTVPNTVDRTTGCGYQLEGEARYDLTPNWQLGAGVRYRSPIRGNTEFVHSVGLFEPALRRIRRRDLSILDLVAVAREAETQGMGYVKQILF
jgi:hypothetical protein